MNYLCGIVFMSYFSVILCVFFPSIYLATLLVVHVLTLVLCFYVWQLYTCIVYVLMLFLKFLSILNMLPAVKMSSNCLFVLKITDQMYFGQYAQVQFRFQFGFSYFSFFNRVTTIRYLVIHMYGPLSLRLLCCPGQHKTSMYDFYLMPSVFLFLFFCIFCAKISSSKCLFLCKTHGMSLRVENTNDLSSYGIYTVSNVNMRDTKQKIYIWQFLNVVTLPVLLAILLVLLTLILCKLLSQYPLIFFGRFCNMRIIV